MFLRNYDNMPRIKKYPEIYIYALEQFIPTVYIRYIDVHNRIHYPAYL